MIKIVFEYRDALSNWKWKEQECLVSSLDEFTKIYGLDKGDCEYRIVSIWDKEGVIK